MQWIRPWSTFPFPAASVQQLRGIFRRGQKLGTPPRTAGHKITTILFFYSDTIHYICNNQLKTYERTTSNYRVPNLRII